MVDVHAAGKVGIDLRLNLHVNENPGLPPRGSRDLDQQVRLTPALTGIANDLLELLVQQPVAQAPVDLGLDGGEEEAQEGLEVAPDGFLPG